MIRSTISAQSVYVDRVMTDLGLDRLQAWRHENQRQRLAEQAARNRRAAAEACCDWYADLEARKALGGQEGGQ